MTGYGILILCVLVLLAVIVMMYRKMSGILNRLDEMIESAINGTFTEKRYSESSLSRLESKMYRYLSSGNTSRKQLTEERDAVKTLVSDISHQTKTPIANILLYTQLLKEQVMEGRARHLVSQIEEQTEKLNFLVQALVKTSRLENGIVALMPKENPVKELLEKLDYPDEKEKKGITITVQKMQEEATAFFDCKWTVEALNNILDNAVKYTPPGGKIEVTAKEYEMFVRIDIADTGIGIPEEETSKIFLRFYRSPSVSEEKGVGIGLYLSREIIGKEGGYIKVSSEPGKGSVFSVFLSKKPILSKL